MVFSIFGRLCNHYLDRNFVIFVTPEENSVPRSSHSSLPHPTRPWQPLTDLNSVLTDLPVLGVSRKWNYTRCGLLQQLLSHSITLSRFARVQLVSVPPSFKWLCDVSSWRIYRTLFTHQSVDGRLVCFHLYCYKHFFNEFVCRQAFISSGQILGSAIAGSYATFHFIIQCSNVPNLEEAHYLLNNFKN